MSYHYKADIYSYHLHTKYANEYANMLMRRQLNAQSIISDHQNIS